MKFTRTLIVEYNTRRREKEEGRLLCLGLRVIIILG